MGEIALITLNLTFGEIEIVMIITLNVGLQNLFKIIKAGSLFEFSRKLLVFYSPLKLIEVGTT